MNYLEFLKKYKAQPLILSQDIVRGLDDPQAMRNQLSRWQKKKLLLKLRKGVYIFSDQPRPSVHWVANQLYEPSYISLESALGFYGMIPERVVDLTSITTRKTMVFKNDMGHFIYRHVKPEVFRGFIRMGEDKSLFFMAEPEKAVVDFLYFNLQAIMTNPAVALKESYRFQNYEGLKPEKLKQWAKLFFSAKLEKAVDAFCGMLEEEGV